MAPKQLRLIFLQVNLFGLVTVTAEFIGGAITPWYRVDAIRLFTDDTFAGWLTNILELMFAVSTLYYFFSTFLALRRLGFREFVRDSWNVLDCMTIILSVVALVLYFERMFAVEDMTKEVRL